METNRLTDELKAIRQKPNQEVIESLERSLTRAKTGELQSFMMARTYADGSGNTWAGIKSEDVPKLLGELLLMATGISHAMDGVDADDIRY